MKLVVDASVAVAASVTPVGFTRFRGIELVAPPLQRALAAPIARMEPESLPMDSWAVADELG